MRGAALACLLGAAASTALWLSAAIAVVVISYLSVYLALGAADPLRIEQLHHRVTAKQRTTVLSVESMAMMAGGSMGSLTPPRPWPSKASQRRPSAPAGHAGTRTPPERGRCGWHSRCNQGLDPQLNERSDAPAW
jgi:hypothetical protein